MKMLVELDAKDYAPDSPESCREAVRAIIRRGDQIAMVYSHAEHYYKFPGGGIEPGESHLEALCREVQEETGLRIKPDSVREFGLVRERRKSTMAQAVFVQNSYYYTAEVEEDVSDQQLDDYEAELGYCLRWTDCGTACEADSTIGVGEPKYDLLRREAYVLDLLRENTIEPA